MESIFLHDYFRKNDFVSPNWIFFFFKTRMSFSLLKELYRLCPGPRRQAAVAVTHQRGEEARPGPLVGREGDMQGCPGHSPGWPADRRTHSCWRPCLAPSSQAPGETRIFHCTLIHLSPVCWGDPEGRAASSATSMRAVLHTAELFHRRPPPPAWRWDRRVAQREGVCPGLARGPPPDRLARFLVSVEERPWTSEVQQQGLQPFGNVCRPLCSKSSRPLSGSGHLRSEEASPRAADGRTASPPQVDVWFLSTLRCMRVMLQYDHSKANIYIYFKMKLSSFEINYLNFLCI